MKPPSAFLRFVRGRPTHGVRSTSRTALLLAGVMLLSSACLSAEQQPGNLSPTASSAPTTPVPSKVAALIATPQTSFDVEFEWNHGVAGEPTTRFSWRQGGGIRRNDVQVTRDTGGFSIETDFPGTSAIGNKTIGCDWYRPPDAQDVRIACGTQVTALPSILLNSLDTALQVGRISGMIGGREIAGLQATCYSFEAVAPGEICTDGSGVPLYFEGAFRQGLFVQTIVATRVSRDGPPPLIPKDLPFTPIHYKIGPSYPVTRLYLPDWGN